MTFWEVGLFCLCKDKLVKIIDKQISVWLIGKKYEFIEKMSDHVTEWLQ